MPGPDPTHWLHRLTADEWLAAAEVELRHCQAALEARGFRTGITHARRAAGMALNAVLVHHPRDAWGRSYMEHVTAICDDATVPEAPRLAARVLRETKPAPPELVTLGKPDLRALEAAREVIAYAREVVRAGERPS